MNHSTGLPEFLFGLLLRLYPKRFRQRYGQELLIFFRAESRRATNRGLLGRSKFWLRTISDTFVAARRYRRMSIPTGPRSPMLMQTLPRHFQLALRAMRRQPSFAFLVVLSLSIGMSAALIVFSLAEAALVEAMPFEEGDGLFFIDGTLADDRSDVRAGSYPEIARWRDDTSAFEGLAAMSGIALNLVTPDLVERIQAEIVGADYFALRRARQIAGRLLGDEDGPERGESAVVVIGETLCERVFDRSDVLGTQITLNEIPLTVVGIVPESFVGLALGAEAWVPMSMTRVVGRDTERRGSRWLTSIARLNDNTSVEAAQAELDGVALDLATEWPQTNDNRTGTLQPAREAYLDTAEDLILLLLGAGVLLLCIASANVAGLLLLRAETQTAEHALCLALGERRAGIGLRVITECFTFAVVAAVISWGLAQATLQWAMSSLPANALPSFVTPRLDAGSLLFMLAAVLLATGVAALIPALWSSRGDLTSALRGSRALGASSGGTRSPQRMFVVAQIATTLVLLVATGLMGRTVISKLNVPTGFDPTDLYAFRVRVPADHEDSAARDAFAASVRDQVAGIPGVLETTYGSDVPLRGGSSAGLVVLAEAPDQTIRYYRHRVSPDYFARTGIQILNGRGFDATDTADSMAVVVVSEGFASRFMPGQNPVGQTLVRAPGFGDIPTTIIGVAASTRWRDLTADLTADGDDPDLYFPFAQFSTRVVEFVVRAETGATELPDAIRQAVRTLAPDAPAYQFTSLNEQLDQQTAGDRLTLVVLATFAVRSLLLAGVGVYGTLAQAVRRRRREIAIRMAVGAAGSVVRRGILSEGMRLTGAGAVFGLVTSLALTRLVSGLLFGVTALDPGTYIVVLAALATLALLATWVPAARATRVDPQAALRSD
ncbi:MAG: FtsX-like permease family protein [Acidobacteria bacterium]|nr:FtsX-like permease family protein [Acidobacteriota bacterium]